MSYRSIFSAADCNTIEAKIKSVESTTSGEIVFCITKRSLPVWISIFVLGAFGWAIGLLIYSILHAIYPWGLTSFALYAFQSLGISAGILVGLSPSLVRRMTPIPILAHFVRLRALRTFTRLGLTKTLARTGVLILVSELEHQVEILADTGIHAKVSADFWLRGATSIADGIREGTGTEAVLSFLTAVEVVLSQHFPPPANDTNELSNEIVRD